MNFLYTAFVLIKVQVDHKIVVTTQTPEVHLEPTRISKMKILAKTVNG